MLAILVGSILSRAVTGEAQFVSAVACTAVLVALHAVLARVAFHSHRFGALIKGEAEVVIRDGVLITSPLKRNAISVRDVFAALRAHGVVELADVAEARLERNGKISVVLREKEGAGSDAKSHKASAPAQ